MHLIASLATICLSIAMLAASPAHAERLPQCSATFVDAWKAWKREDPLDPQTMPLPKKPCCLMGNYNTYACSEEVQGCGHIAADPCDREQYEEGMKLQREMQ